MITRLGWQTVLADLSLILFMITAQSLSISEASRLEAARQPGSSEALPPAPMLAVYRDVPGAPPLSQWLAAQAPDPRALLTIRLGFLPGEEDAALKQLGRLLVETRRAGVSARVIAEPGEGEITATLAYDASLFDKGS